LQNEASERRLEIEQFQQAFCEQFNCGDVEAMQEFFTDESHISSPGEDVNQGHVAIQAYLHGVMHGLAINMELLECDELCNDSIVNGNFSFTDKFGFGREVECGRYMAHIRREQNGLKIHSLCLNSTRRKGCNR